MIIVVTGKIGSGKDTLTSFLQEEFFVVDADKIVGKFYKKEGYKVAYLFGKKVVKGKKVDKKRVADIVFNDEDALLRLESIILPFVENEMWEEVEHGLPQDILINAVTLYKIPSVVKFCDAIIYVKAKKDIRLKRVLARDGGSKESFFARNRVQKGLLKKYTKSFSHYFGCPAIITIDNNGSLEDLKKNTTNMIRILRKEVEKSRAGL